MTTKNKILKAIEDNRLSLDKEGYKLWYNYKLHITFLSWKRNLYEGYKIIVYNKFTNKRIETIIYSPFETIIY